MYVPCGHSKLVDAAHTCLLLPAVTAMPKQGAVQPRQLPMQLVQTRDAQRLVHATPNTHSACCMQHLILTAPR